METKQTRYNEAYTFMFIRMKTSLLLLSLISLLACHTLVLIEPAQADVDRMKNKYPDLSLDELKQGKQNFERYCGNCHKHKNPNSRSEKQWSKIVPQMCQKVNKRNNNVLDEKAQQGILRYVLSVRGAPKKR